jgi:ABC-type Zn uptake system ZnuABC Zn-binding protein ZnuA
MRSNSARAIFVCTIMILSSLAGCLSDDVEPNEDGTPGTVIVSTYHIEQLVSAVAGNTLNVQILSPSNVPVHDYEPSAADLIALQSGDVFFYHGLNLEPWVETTLSALGSDAPTAVMTHAMPAGQDTLDYESLLISELCEHLSEGATEFIPLGEDADKLNESDELHAEHITYNLAFPEHEGEEGHDEGNETHDEHDEGNESHDEHDAHNHAQPEETIMNPESCPSDTVIYLFHLESGDVLLEFESEIEWANGFDMVVLPMGGSHAGHGHGEEGHDGHEEDNETHNETHNETDTDDDHDGHGDNHGDHDEEMTPEHALEEFDSNNDSNLSWDEFWAGWATEDDHDGNDDHNDTHDDHDDTPGDTHDDHDDHDDHDEHDEHGESELMENFNLSDVDSDGLLNLTELTTFVESVNHFVEEHEGHDEHAEHEDHEAGYAVLHIEEEGDYGIALPHDVELFVIMDGHDDHDAHGEDDDDHDAHGEDDDDHDAHGEDDDDHDAHGEDDDDHDDHDDHDEEGHEEDLAFDPHSWLDPLAFKAQVNLVLENLITLFPSQEATFKANAAAYIAQLDGLHTDYEAAFSDTGTCSNSTVVANHAAYNYMANRYDLEFITVHGVDPEGEPTAEDIAMAVEYIQEEGVSVFFIEEYTSPDAVKSIVDQTTSSTMPSGVSIQYLYTMELPPSNSDDDYLSLMQKNLVNLKAGLGC